MDNQTGARTFLSADATEYPTGFTSSNTVIPAIRQSETLRYEHVVRVGRWLLLAFVLLIHTITQAAEIVVPKTNDPQLEISLFASEPQIVTPIGLAIDQQSRLFVIESHTHETKPDYLGPKHDRVKVFTDAGQDGKPENVSIFADGLRHTMNLAFSPKQELYLAHRSGILILHDRDRDGVSENRSAVIELKTAGTYPHNGIDGIAFAPDGWLYFGLGENLGLPYTVQGTDGSKHSGGGEGGNVFRCRSDGSQVQLVATGFWNPFALEFDREGNLFCVDNDPDGRPPCRLLHVVDDADFGYKFRYGRSGQHPFVAWDGELPGTLPMVAGTGEAPSGILDCGKARLPVRRRNSLLVTSWGDNSLELYPLKAVGASFRSTKEIVVQGDKSFRPVAIAANGEGTIYVTDWADQSYPVHQKGRIWRLAARSGVGSVQPATARNVEVALEDKLERLLNSTSSTNYSTLLVAAKDDDPFVRSSAISALAHPNHRVNILRDVANADAKVRLSALLALRKGKHSQPASILRKFLADPDEQVRLISLVWAGEETLIPLTNIIDVALTDGNVTPAVFKAYLAAAEILTAAASPTPRPKGPVWDQGATGSGLIERMLRDDSKPPALRAIALTMVPNIADNEMVDLLIKLIQGTDQRLRIEAIRTLAQSASKRGSDLLQEVALAKTNSGGVRAEAVLALAAQPLDVWKNFLPLLDDPEPAVRLEVARTLRMYAADASISAALERKANTLGSGPGGAALKEQLDFARAFGRGSDAGKAGLNRPGSDEQWPTVLSGAGDADSGRRTFFHPAVTCSKCHQVQGRGGKIGPDLSVIARSSDRAKLIQSILNPSQDVAPQFVQYQVETKNDQTVAGLLNVRTADGSMTLTTGEGRVVNVSHEAIVSVRQSQVSLMPDGLEESMTVQDFRDLLAFLLSLK